MPRNDRLAEYSDEASWRACQSAQSCAGNTGGYTPAGCSRAILFWTHVASAFKLRRAGGSPYLPCTAALELAYCVCGEIDKIRHMQRRLFPSCAMFAGFQALYTRIRMNVRAQAYRVS